MLLITVLLYVLCEVNINYNRSPLKESKVLEVKSTKAL